MSGLTDLPTPCYVIDEGRLEENCKILAGVMNHTGCKILLAQKAFSAYACYPLIGKYLSGTTASGLYEARLGHEEMNGLHETHIFSPAYKEEEFDEIAALCDHIIFNSLTQYEKYKNRCPDSSIGLRVNPECSTQECAIYDPCAPGSRLGITSESFYEAVSDTAPNHIDISLIEGLHFHTLCEQDADALAATLDAVEAKFSELLCQVKWVNFGGGHHITKKGYDIALLERCICRIRDKYHVQVYLEPGEAVALNAGYLVTEVLDFVDNHGIRTAILDTSAACHMPDVLEMPYRPPLQESGLPDEKPYTYRLAGCTCLAGDVIGDYSFSHPLQIGSRLIFEDMAIYTMVKNNTFNGMPLPSIYTVNQEGQYQLLKQFHYSDFKERLS